MKKNYPVDSKILNCPFKNEIQQKWYKKNNNYKTEIESRWKVLNFNAFSRSFSQEGKMNGSVPNGIVDNTGNDESGHGKFDFRAHLRKTGKMDPNRTLRRNVDNHHDATQHDFRDVLKMNKGDMKVDNPQNRRIKV